MCRYSYRYKNHHHIIKPTRRTNLFLERRSTCFGQFLCPSSGVFHCTHSNGLCHTSFARKPVWHIRLLRVQWKTPDDGQRKCPKHVQFHSKNKLDKLLHLVGFSIRIYHVARLPECQSRRLQHHHHHQPQLISRPGLVPVSSVLVLPSSSSSICFPTAGCNLRMRVSSVLNKFYAYLRPQSTLVSFKLQVFIPPFLLLQCSVTPVAFPQHFILAVSRLSSCWRTAAQLSRQLGLLALPLSCMTSATCLDCLL